MSNFLIKDFQGVTYKKNLKIELTPDDPSPNGNVFSIDQEIQEFLLNYFKETLESNDSILKTKDIEESEYKIDFDSLLYILWKYLIRYKEIYLNLSDLNILREIIFVTEAEWLTNNLPETNYSIILNLSSKPIKYLYNNSLEIPPYHGKLVSTEFNTCFMSTPDFLVVLFRLF